MQLNRNDWWKADDIEAALARICVSSDTHRATAFDLEQIFYDLDYYPDIRILEIGCGVGRLILPLRKQYSIVDGTDNSPSYVELSKEYLKDFLDKGRIVLNDGYTLPFEDNYYNFVFSFTTFQHIRSVPVFISYLRETHRVLRPGGIFRYQMHDMSNPNFGRWEENFSVVWGNAYTSEELDVLMRAMNYHDINIEEKTPWIWVTARK